MDNTIWPMLITFIVAVITIIVTLHIERRKDKKEIEMLNKDIKMDQNTIQSLREKLERINLQFLELQSSIPKLVKQERQQAVTTSRAVLKGKISEEIVPLLPNFPYQISDMKFFGSPVDFIIFDGMSNGVINNIIFLDVKTGGSNLSPIQRKIREAIQAGRVSWHTYVKE